MVLFHSSFLIHCFSHGSLKQFLAHKRLPEKSCLHCLRILIMSWLFKDPISSGLAQFDHAQSNSKNGLKAKKIKLPQMNFFLKK